MREHQIEADQVGGHEDADAAGQRQQPPTREPAASACRAASRGIEPAGDPQQRRDAEQHRGRGVERERAGPAAPCGSASVPPGASSAASQRRAPARAPATPACAPVAAATGTPPAWRAARPSAAPSSRRGAGHRATTDGRERGGRSPAAARAAAAARPSSSAQIASASTTACRPREIAARRTSGASAGECRARARGTHSRRPAARRAGSPRPTTIGPRPPRRSAASPWRRSRRSAAAPSATSRRARRRAR